MMQLRVLLVTLTVPLLVVTGAGGSSGNLAPSSALATFGDESLRLFTTAFCEPGRCMDALPGVRRDGRAVLPVLVAASGERVSFLTGFQPRSLRLTVRSGFRSETTLLTDGTWVVPVDLALPAALELNAEGDGRRATFLALLDRTAPAPQLDRALSRGGAFRGRRLFRISFRLCSWQSGRVRVVVVQSRRGGQRQASRVVSSDGHLPGCATYRLEHVSLWWKPGVAERLQLRASVGRSELSAPTPVQLG